MNLERSNPVAREEAGKGTARFATKAVLIPDKIPSNAGSRDRQVLQELRASPLEPPAVEDEGARVVTGRETDCRQPAAAPCGAPPDLIL